MDTAILDQPLDIANLDAINVLAYKPNYKLTIENVAALLLKGITNQSQMGRLLGVSRQAIDQYLDRHADTLRVLIDNTDTALAIRFKKQAIDYLDSIDTDTIQKASLLQRMTASGIATDKYRLLSGQSTENISLRVSDSERSDIEQIAREAAIKAMRTQDVVSEPVSD
jgi:hypothetical protein